MGDVIINVEAEKDRVVHPKWTPEEDFELLRLYSIGWTHESMGRHLGRTRGAVTQRLLVLARKQQAEEAKKGKAPASPPPPETGGASVVERAAFLVVVQMGKATPEQVATLMGATLEVSAGALKGLADAGEVFTLGDLYLPTGKALLRLAR